MPNQKKKKIAVAVTHRAPYGRLKPVLAAIKNHPDLELQVMIGVPVFTRHLSSALIHTDWEALKRSLGWYARHRLKRLFNQKKTLETHDALARTVIKDGFDIAAEIPLFFEGGKPETMVKSIGVGITALPKILKTLQPDIVLVHADRFEMFAVATAASFMNIPVAHLQGGDVSGTIDESVRHAITKLAHMHFPTSEKSKERILRMGENPDFVYMMGCPTIDELKSIDLSIDGDIFKRNGHGHGHPIDISKPYVLVLQHPVTTEHGKISGHIEETLAALQKLNMQVLMLAPNLDAGSDEATKAVRAFAKDNHLPGFSLYKNFFPDDFYRVLNGATLAVGNSSSFIREGSYLGVSAVLVGTRQQGRERAGNVMEVPYEKDAIFEAMKNQIAHGRYESSSLYGDGTASTKIADTLARVTPSVQKSFFD